MVLAKYRLGDIATVAISGIDKKTVEGEIPVSLCNFVDVYYNWAITKDHYPLLMNATARQSEIDEFTLHKGCVAITKDSETRNDIGSACYIADDFDDVVVLGYHTALITPNPQFLDGKYLNALLHTSYFQKYWYNNASGSGQRFSLSLETLLDAVLYLPDIQTQHRVGDILSHIDRKTSLLKRETALLDDLTRQLYDYWFVQFDFPDVNGDPYKTSGGEMEYSPILQRDIPKGWSVDMIGNHISTIRGQSYDGTNLSESGIPMLNLASFKPGGGYNVAGLKYFKGIYSPDKVLEPFDLVMCNTQQTAIDFSKDIIGNAVLVPDVFDGVILSSHHVTNIKCDSDGLKYYYYCLFNTTWFHKYISRYTNGTNILGLIFKGVEDYPTPIPPTDILDEFSKLIKDVEKRKSVIIKEMASLYELQSYILPVLMNGQAKIQC